MSLNPVWISILREKRESDGAGGKTVVLSSDRKRYQAVIARRRTRSSEERLEEGAHNSLGPGGEEARRRVIMFRLPFPQLKTNDRLVAHDGSPAGTPYIVHHLRPYDWTLQADAEVVS